MGSYSRHVPKKTFTGNFQIHAMGRGVQIKEKEPKGQKFLLVFDITA